jgi:hypothetical protein
MWVEADLNMPDGEALVRSILIGKRWFLEGIWRRCAHRLESRFLRIHVAVAADLQTLWN